MPVIRLYPSGQEVPYPSGETVLAVLEKAGYALPNNCRAGACGECKVKVRSGSFDQGMVLDMALSAEERDQGYGLMCMAKPLGEVLEIEWGTDDAQPKLFPPRENLPFVVTDRIARTARILELRLRPLGRPLRFWPGQYVMLSDDEGQVPARSYSIANAPQQDGELTLQVSRLDGGATSAWVHDRLRPGDRVRLAGPYGSFIGDPSVDTPVLCLAAGSGLAPILSLTATALRRGFRHPVTLLFSARREADVYDRGLLAYWQVRHRNFTFRPTLTREPGPGLTGRIPDILPGLFPDLSGHSVFIAGSTGFVEACRDKVKSLGAKDELVHTEGFFERQQPEPPPRDRLAPTGPKG